jgi:hypothetical protein
MTLDELLRHPDRRSLAAQPEADLLTERDALQEADIVDVRLDAGHARLEVLFDLRQALQFRDADTAVLVVTGLERFEWAGQAPATDHRMAHPVMSSMPAHADGRIRLLFECLPDVQISIDAASAEFFVGSIPGLPEAPPNFVDDDEVTISTGMPGWSSEFDGGWATFLDAGE